MDSRQKNIIQAAIRVVGVAGAVVLSWISNIFVWVFGLPTNTEEEEFEESYGIKAGMFVHRVGSHRTIIDTLDEDT